MLINEILVENLLATLVAQDQKERKNYQAFVQAKAGGDYTRGAKLYAQAKNRPANDVFGERSRLAQFINTKFDYSKFSKTDWENYWLLAQHCDFNRPFQQQALKLIQQYLGAESEEYQYLYDRISCGLTGTQKYGTQDGCSKDAV